MIKMKEETLIKNCVTCGKEIIEGKNIKENWHLPMCDDCREIIMNYLMQKDKIDRIMRFRFKQEQNY
jgi:endogenous inhibitor of DNA gyrase (YacG/DUF329 family)